MITSMATALLAAIRASAGVEARRAGRSARRSVQGLVLAHEPGSPRDLARRRDGARARAPEPHYESPTSGWADLVLAAEARRQAQTAERVTTRLYRMCRGAGRQALFDGQARERPSPSRLDLPLTAENLAWAAGLTYHQSCPAEAAVDLGGGGVPARGRRTWSRWVFAAVAGVPPWRRDPRMATPSPAWSSASRRRRSCSGGSRPRCTGEPPSSGRWWNSGEPVSRIGGRRTVPKGAGSGWRGSPTWATRCRRYSPTSAAGRPGCARNRAAGHRDRGRAGACQPGGGAQARPRRGVRAPRSGAQGVLNHLTHRGQSRRPLLPTHFFRHGAEHRLGSLLIDRSTLTGVPWVIRHGRRGGEGRIRTAAPLALWPLHVISPHFLSLVSVGRPEEGTTMWDAFVDAWAIAAGAVPAPPQPSEELQRAVSILLGLPETDLMTRLDGAQTTGSGTLVATGGQACGPCRPAARSVTRSSA